MKTMEVTINGISYEPLLVKIKAESMSLYLDIDGDANILECPFQDMFHVDAACDMANIQKQIIGMCRMSHIPYDIVKPEDVLRATP